MTLLDITLLAQRNWPLAGQKQARRQAVRLIRAKRYLDRRGIAATAINSEFKYSAQPTVLA